jgi:hypothetical protein
VAQKFARFILLTVAVAGLRLGTARLPGGEAARPAPRPERTVFLGGDLTDLDLLVFTANFAASGHPGVVLVDGPKATKANRAFLDAFQPDELIAVGSFSEGITSDLQRRLGVRITAALPWKRGPPPELWKSWFARAEQVVVCPPEPRPLVLQAACLAGTLGVPLWVLPANGDSSDLAQRIAEWHTRRILAAGLPNFGRDLPRVNVIHLPDEEAVAALALRHLPCTSPVQALVVANPADAKKELAGMSVLAPLLAIQHHGALLLTNERGDNTASVVRDALKSPRLRAADNLLLAADLTAIPLERRPNPVPGKDTFIEMEPLTPTGTEPFSFATGRLFHEDPSVVLLMLARQRLLQRAGQQQPPAPRKALVVSNPGGSLPLLEMFSRNTAWEFRNRGYQTTTLFGDEVSKETVKRELPRHDIFLWEGHHSTLVKDYHFPQWTEPLPPSLMFLQSCLALTDAKTHPLLERGAVAVVGSSTRTYSATGGAFSLAFFNGLLYEDQSLGGSLRQAKNFLLAYSLLKEKRLGKEAKLAGANVRSAWAFSLWGDPTLKLPLPTAAAEARPPVRHEVHGNSIVVTLPDADDKKLRTSSYAAPLRANTYLAGLIGKPDSDQKTLVPFLFAEIALPKAPANQTPRLRSRLPESHYVFTWDSRRRCGYLLILPRQKDQHELRFHIDWETSEQHVVSER